ncbi:barstar family protein [Pantoea vagans]|uniref:barstar family protein n=1 Tax=Pantoea vagans TaxID=470934 RepID=UPI00301590BE
MSYCISLQTIMKRRHQLGNGSNKGDMYRNVIIEGDQVDSEHDFHRVIANTLDFGECYGNNTDSLWDMLSSGMACGVCINWRKSFVSRRNWDSLLMLLFI